MSHGMVVRLRSLVLLLAFGIGLLGQIVAAVAMPMPLLMPQVTVASSTSTAHAGACPACSQQDTRAPVMTPACLLAFCSIAPAVLPIGPIVAHFPHATFQTVALYAGLGITVRPALGPPRPFQQT
jgi:hypothetical protein